MNAKLKALAVPEHLSHMVDPVLRTIVLPSSITQKLYQQFDMAMAYLERLSEDQITINICCNGGDVETAIAMVGRIERSPCLTIASGYGKIMSAAIYIFASCDEREAHKLASFLWHEQSVSLGHTTLGTLKYDSEQMHKNYLQLCNWMEERTGTSESFWIKKGTNSKDYVFTTDEAIKLGLCQRKF